MRKTDKKIENTIREVLTDVCELALKDVVGFKWLTHGVANYKKVSESILITCVFETEKSLSIAAKENKESYFQSLIKEKLSVVNIDIKNIQKQVCFDTEEACEKHHHGNWKDRLND